MKDQRFRTFTILVAIVVVFAALNIGLAFNVGALSVPTIYDDNGYLLDAYQRVAFDGVRSVSDIFRSFLSKPPRAPVETLSTMAGFYLFGPHNYGAYIMNVWGLLAFATGIYVICRRRIGSRFALLMVVALMFVPATGAIMTELRPDMIAAALFAFSGYWLITFGYDKLPVSRSLLLGAFVAFSMIVKLSAAIITIPMLGFAWGLGMIRRIPERRFVEAMPAAAVVAGTVLILLTPIVYVWGYGTYEYIKAAVFTQSDIWNTPGSWLLHLAFNSFGYGGRNALGIFLYVGIIAIGADIVSISLRKARGVEDLQTAAYYLWCAVIYIGTAISQVKNLYQGSFFYFPFIVATVVAISRGLGTSNRAVSHIATAAVALYAIAFMPPSNSYQDGRYRPETQEMLNQISSLVSRNVGRIPACGNAMPLFTAANSYPITPEAVALDVGQKERKRIEIAFTYAERSIDQVADIMGRSNFVLFPNEAGLKEAVIQRLPGVGFLDEMKARLEKDPKWSEHRIDVTDAPTLFIRTGC
jgi:4-amino-4-deoxy-L-arabinose transferase-like glycosyltransferase